MSMVHPNDDKRRNVLPPPPGRSPSRQDSMSTFLKLTDKTGLTTMDGNKPVIPQDQNPIPAVARIFTALPSVTAKDIVQPYRGMIVRK